MNKNLILIMVIVLCCVINAPKALAETIAPPPPKGSIVSVPQVQIIKPGSAIASIDLPPDNQFPNGGLTIAEFTRQVLFELLNKQAVLPTELLQLTDTIAVSYRDNPKTAFFILQEVLKSKGFEIAEKSNVVFVNKLKVPKEEDPKADFEHYTIKPKHRPVSCFLSVIKTFENAESSSDSKESKCEFTQNPDSFTVKVLKRDGKKLLNAIEEEDKPFKFVTLKASIVEVALSDNQSSGVFLAAKAFGRHLGITVGNTQSSYLFNVKGANFEFGISSLNSDSAFSTRSFPATSVLSGQSTKLESVTSFPLTVKTEQDNKTTTSTTYQKVGTSITVVPTVIGDTIFFKVEMTSSDFASQSTSNLAPTLVERNFSTIGQLKSGQAIILAGLDLDRSNKSKNSLFGFTLDRGNTSSRSNLVLAIQAELIDSTQVKEEDLPAAPPTREAGRSAGEPARVTE